MNPNDPRPLPSEHDEVPEDALAASQQTLEALGDVAITLFLRERGIKARKRRRTLPTQPRSDAADILPERSPLAAPPVDSSATSGRGSAGIRARVRRRTVEGSDADGAP